VRFRNAVAIDTAHAIPFNQKIRKPGLAFHMLVIRLTQMDCALRSF
jgi:hypothetical protein